MANVNALWLSLAEQKSLGFQHHLVLGFSATIVRLHRAARTRDFGLLSTRHVQKKVHPRYRPPVPNKVALQCLAPARWFLRSAGHRTVAIPPCCCPSSRPGKRGNRFLQPERLQVGINSVVISCSATSYKPFRTASAWTSSSMHQSSHDMKLRAPKGRQELVVVEPFGDQGLALICTVQVYFQDPGRIRDPRSGSRLLAEVVEPCAQGPMRHHLIDVLLLRPLQWDLVGFCQSILDPLGEPRTGGTPRKAQYDDCHTHDYTSKSTTRRLPHPSDSNTCQSK